MIVLVVDGISEFWHSDLAVTIDVCSNEHWLQVLKLVFYHFFSHGFGMLFDLIPGDGVVSIGIKLIHDVLGHVVLSLLRWWTAISIRYRARLLLTIIFVLWSIVVGRIIDVLTVIVLWVDLIAFFANWIFRRIAIWAIRIIASDV